MIPPSTTIGEEGRRIRSRVLAALAAFVGIVLLVAVARLLDRSTAVDGPVGSSFVTTPPGAGAWFETLERLGRDPARLRAPLPDPRLDTADAYVLLEPGLAGFGDPELSALRSFAEGGGTVVIGGSPPGPVASSLLDEPPTWSPGAVTEAHIQDPPPGLDDLEGGTVVGGRFGVFDDPGSATPFLVAGDEALGVWERVGDGAVVLIADVAVFTNQNLDEAENAELAVALAGRGAVFDEFRHGYTEPGAGGALLGLPGRWDAAVALLGVALVAGLVAYGRRLGPPEPVERDLSPPRRLYLESLARTLRRTGDPVAATESVRRAVWERIVARSGPGGDPSEEELRAEARRLGLADAEIDALLSPSADTVLAADRALARLARTPSDDPGADR